MKKVKICGITDVLTAKQACAFGADALGFVFARSKRQITPEEAKAIIKQLPKQVLKIGVFVNEQAETVREIAAYSGLDCVQLHGEESQQYCDSLGLPIIKAFGVATKEDVTRAFQYDVDYILLDSPKDVYQGGNGKRFDWRLVEGLSREQRQKLILAGGLNEQNVKQAAKLIQPYMVDASSSLETNGTKDIEKIKRFIETVKEWKYA
jgi:phosphoribosylanthranilate isomerase